MARRLLNLVVALPGVVALTGCGGPDTTATRAVSRTEIMWAYAMASQGCGGGAITTDRVFPDGSRIGHCTDGSVVYSMASGSSGWCRDGQSYFCRIAIWG